MRRSIPLLVLLLLAPSAAAQTGPRFQVAGVACNASVVNVASGGTCSPPTLTINAGGGGTVTSISAGAGITLTPNPIIATGTVAVSLVPIANGGTNATACGTNAVPGNVAYWGGTSYACTSTSDLTWDNTNKRLGIGNASPAYPLDVAGTISGTTLQGTSAAVLTVTSGNTNAAAAGLVINSEPANAANVPQMLLENHGHVFAGFYDLNPGAIFIALNGAGTRVGFIQFTTDGGGNTVFRFGNAGGGVASLVPGSDAGADVGTGAVRWHDGNFSGTVTASALSGSGSAISGFGGDITGTVGSATVAKINGSILGTTTTATNGQALVWNTVAAQWQPGTPANATTAVNVTGIVALANGGTGHASGVPSVSTGTAIGANGTCSISGDDIGSQITITTQIGDGPFVSNAAMCTVTFSGTFSATPTCVLMSANDAAWNLTYGSVRYRNSDGSATTAVIWNGAVALPTATATYIYNLVCWK